MSKWKMVLLLAYKGYRLTKAGEWKNRGAVATFLVAVGAGVYAWSGVDLGISQEEALGIATGIIAIGHLVLNYITSRKVGLPAGAKPVDWEDGQLPPWLAGPGPRDGWGEDHF